VVSGFLKDNKMAITVQHGPNQSYYASILGKAAKNTANYDRMRDVADFMQQVKQDNRDYELGKEQNKLTGRGQDIQYDLGLKNVALDSRRVDLQEIDQDRAFRLGWRAQELAELTQSQAYELGLLKIRNDKSMGMLESAMQNPNRFASVMGVPMLPPGSSGGPYIPKPGGIAAKIWS